MIQLIKLSNLRRSERNVRRTYPFANVEALACDIAARGILQNLNVIPTGENNGTFEVIGGGRRLAALELLLSRGVIDADYDVPCGIRDADDAEEDSLAENIQQVAMSAVDQFRAFATLIDQGKSVGEVATRFGLSERTVEQRLKLGRLSPRLLDLLRDGKLGQEQCEAFALTDDQGVQERVYDALARSHSLHPSHIRSNIAQDRVSMNSKLGRFVRQDYEAKGMPITRDLFSDDGGYLDDRAAALEIATAKLQAECERLVSKEGWAWAKPMLEYDYTALSKYRFTHPDEQPELTPEQEAERAALVIEHNQILTLYRPDLTVGRPGGPAALDTPPVSDEDDEDCQSLEETMNFGEEDEADDEADAGAEPQTIPQADLDRMADLKRQIAEIDAQKEDRYSADLKAKAGVFVVIGQNGDYDHHEGYMVPDAGVDGAAPATTRGGAADGSAIGSSKPAKGPYSAPLLADLSAHRSQAFQLALAQRPDYAKSYMLYVMWAKFSMRSNLAAASNLTGHYERLTATMTNMADTPAGVALAKLRDTFAAKLAAEDVYTGRDAVALFQAIHGLDEQDKDAMLAMMFAQTISIGLAQQGGHSDDVVEHVGAAIGCDPAKTWRPSGAEFWGRVSKGFVFDEAAVVGKGIQVLTPMKKGQIVETLDRWFSNPAAIKLSDLGPVDAEANGPIPQKMVAEMDSWLPPGMAFGGADAADEDGGTAQADAA